MRNLFKPQFLLFLKIGHLFVKKILFFFGSGKLGFYFGMLGNNFVKLKDRQIPDIAIRLIVTNVFRIAIRMKRIRKTDKLFVFAIMTKSHFYRILKN